MNPRRHGWLLGLLLGTVSAAPVVASTASAASASAEIAVTDDRGRVIELPRAPARIVSLLPSATETVCELQLCERLVGVDRFSDWPQGVRSLPKVGGLEDAHLERIVALKPDLVLAGRFARVTDRLEAMGIPVLVLEAKDFPDARRVIELVAEALGSQRAGQALWRRLNERIDAAAARVPPRFRGQRVYFEVAPGPFAAGEISFEGEMLDRLGLGNIVPAALGPFPKLNPEYVVRERPYVIMASAREVAEMAGRPGWERLDAMRSGRVCRFANEFFPVLLRPGPRLGEAAEAVVDCLVALDRTTQ